MAALSCSHINHEEVANEATERGCKKSTSKRGDWSDRPRGRVGSISADCNTVVPAGGIARYISPQSDRAYLGLLVEVESTWPTDGLRWLRADVGTEPMQF